MLTFSTLAFFYKRSELAYRVGLQISAAPLATSFASSLAWVIVKLSQDGPIEPWRVLLLVEGFPSIFTAIAAYYFIPDTPSTARYLTLRERKVATLRLQSLDAPHTETEPQLSSLALILRTLISPISLLPALMFLSINVAFASLPVFLPTIIASMSFSPLTSQALSAPPYLFAFFSVLLIGHHSDRANSRSAYLLFTSVLSGLSYATIAFTGYLSSTDTIDEITSISIRYLAIYPAAIGLFSSVVLIITWSLNNQQSSTARGAGLTILNIVGQCGPLIGVRLFPKDEGPYYVKGMAVSAAFMAAVAVLSLGLRLYLQRLNARLHGLGEYEMVHGRKDARTEEQERLVVEVEEMMSPDEQAQPDGPERFRYML